MSVLILIAKILRRACQTSLIKWGWDQQNEVSFLVSGCQLHFTQVPYICRCLADLCIPLPGISKVSVVKFMK